MIELALSTHLRCYYLKSCCIRLIITILLTMYSSLILIHDCSKLITVFIFCDFLLFSILFSVLLHFECLHMSVQGGRKPGIISSRKLLLLLWHQSREVCVLLFCQGYKFWLYWLSTNCTESSLDFLIFWRGWEHYFFSSLEDALQNTLFILWLLFLLGNLNLSPTHIHNWSLLSEGLNHRLMWIFLLQLHIWGFVPIEHLHINQWNWFFLGSLDLVPQHGESGHFEVFLLVLGIWQLIWQSSIFL